MSSKKSTEGKPNPFTNTHFFLLFFFFYLFIETHNHPLININHILCHLYN